MTIKVPSAGEIAMLKDALGKTSPSTLTLKLFVNDVVPGDADTAATYTEMSTLGYASKSLATATWAVAANGSVAQATYTAQTWTFTAGAAVTVYGYYVVGADTIIRWAERFDAPFSAQYTNDTITVTPQFTFGSAA